MGFLQLKSVVHHQDYVNVVGRFFFRDEAPENHKPSKMSRALGKLVNVDKVSRTPNSLVTTTPESLDDLFEASAMKPSRQVPAVF